MRKRTVVGGVTAAVLVAGAAGAGLWWRHAEAGEGSRPGRPGRGGGLRQPRGRAAPSPSPGSCSPGTTDRRVQADFAKATAGLGIGPVKVTAGRGASHGRQGHRHRARHVDPGRWGRLVLRRAGHRAAGRDAEPVGHHACPAPLAVAPRAQDRRHADGHPHVGRPRRPCSTGTAKAAHADRQGLPGADRPARATPPPSASSEKVVDEPAGSLVAKLAAGTKAGSKAPIPVSPTGRPTSASASPPSMP